MTINQTRRPAGIPSGGQFAGTTHSEAHLSLARPAVDDGFTTTRLRELGLQNRLTEAQAAEVTRNINTTLDFSDRGIRDAADTLLRRDYGYGFDDARTMSTLEDELRRDGRTEEADALARVAAAAYPEALDRDDDTFATEEELAELASRLLPDGVETPVPASDPRLQSGQIFDKVVAEDGTVFHRRRPGTFPGTPYSMRFQASRPLGDDEKRQFAGLVGYAYRSTVAGERIGDPESDSPYSFTVGSDMTKSSRDDLGLALEDFEEELPALIQEGSPARKTDRTGPVGSRLIDGFSEPGLTFEVYYDDVL